MLGPLSPCLCKPKRSNIVLYRSTGTWSLHSDAELYLPAVYLSQYRTPPCLYSRLPLPFPMRQCSHAVTENTNCILRPVCAQLPLPGVFILSLQKKHPLKKIKKHLCYLPKAGGMSYFRECHKGHLSSDASQSGNFQDALKRTFLFRLIYYS